MRILISCLLLACLASPAFAVSTQEAHEQLAKDYQHWEKTLKQSYREARTRCEHAPDPQSCQNQLRQAQRAWESYMENMQAYIRAREADDVAGLKTVEFSIRAMQQQNKELTGK